MYHVKRKNKGLKFKWIKPLIHTYTQFKIYFKNEGFKFNR